MLVASTVAILVLAGQQNDTRTYRDDKLGLMFQHPKAWAVRKERLYSVIEFATPGGAKIQVQIQNSSFRATKEDWQQIQKDVNITNRREVLRQWEEELLGVPLLLTSLQYTEVSGSVRQLIGLLYTKSNEKLLYRVISPAEAADEAEAMWKSAILTLRTTSGVLPDVENPDNPVVPEKKPVKPDKIITMKQTDGKPSKPVKAPKINGVEALGQRVNVLTPEGWTVTKEGEIYTMTHPEVTGKVLIELGNITESAAKPLLLMSSGKLLSRFDSVALRTETPGGYNNAAFWICQVTRTGKAKEADLVLVQTIGAGAGLYWLVTYESTDTTAFSKETPLLNGLFQSMSVEFAQS